jgi:hypothetical protein
LLGRIGAGGQVDSKTQAMIMVCGGALVCGVLIIAMFVLGAIF